MSEHNRITVFRVIFLMICATVIFGALIGRLYFLQIVQAPDLVARSERARNLTFTIPPVRGNILDRHSHPLAVGQWTYTVIADKKLMEDIPTTLRQAGGLLGLSAQEIEEHIRRLEQKDRQAIELERQIDESVKKQLEALELKGIAFQKQEARYYPEGTLAAQLIGYTGKDNQGLDGLEFSLDHRLQGRALTITTDTDPRRKKMSTRDYTKMDNHGLDVILTIDSYIQYVVERELQGVLERTKAQYANAIVQHAKTGEILAMGNAPLFNPNEYQEFPLAVRKNRMVTNFYEPGSVMKPFTLLAALERDRVEPDTIIDCEDGSFYFRGHVVRDDIHRFGLMSLHDILVRSSNIGTIKTTLMLTEDPNDFRGQAKKLYQTYRSFGFKHKEQCLEVLPGGSGGILKPPNDWQPAAIRAVPFGQGMATTTLVLNNAYCALANRGLYRDPQIIKGYRGMDNILVPKEPEPVTRVCAQEPVEQVVDMMVDVVQDPEGTGRRVRIPGFRIAGKTGTAQKVDPEIGTYGRGMRIATFSGFFPAKNPEVVITVMVDEPQIGKYGGEVAGPVWKTIAEEIIAYWGLTPSHPEEIDAEEPSTQEENLEADENEALMAGMHRLPVNHLQQTALEPGAMPSLIGMTRRDAYVALSRIGLTAKFEGAGKVVEQPLAAGTVLNGTHHIGVVKCQSALTDPDLSLGEALLVQR